MSHRNTRVSASVVYNEYIANKTHMHMNATQWTTLTEFVLYLGKEGKCKIEDTPKGWFLLYKPVDHEEAGLTFRRRVNPAAGRDPRGGRTPSPGGCRRCGTKWMQSESGRRRRTRRGRTGCWRSRRARILILIL